MALHKTSETNGRCEKCGAPLPTTSSDQLSRDSRGGLPSENIEPVSLKIRPAVVWAASFAVWFCIGMAATLAYYQMYRMSPGKDGHLWTAAVMEFSQLIGFFLLTPPSFWLAVRYPIQRANWVKPVLVHLAAGLVFTMGHLIIRGLTPYGYYDAGHKIWTYTFWDVQAHSFRFPGAVLQRVFMTNVVDDVTTVYLPIVIVAHAALYYRKFQEKELRAAQFAAQLTTARLQVLKSQMQPHFLFNTLHSISALMLTNVAAADRMMTSLSDLLRLSLENNGKQLTTLGNEIEFLSVYLEIEKTRFEDKLQVDFDIEPECLDTQVPHLLLQPLVENAVRHGISKRSQPGQVRVLARRNNGSLQVWIQDTGPGFDAPSEELFKRGLGLSVARERLQTLYAERQECKIKNLLGGGAEVYLRIPFSPVRNASDSEALTHSYM